MNRTLIFGYGYLGRRAAELSLSRGDAVYATTRSTKKLVEIEKNGCVPILCDWTDKRSLANLPTIDQVLVAVSFDRKSPIDRETAMVGGLKTLLHRLAGQASELPRTQSDNAPEQSPAVCYISTTGVYHQKQGVWVDESSTTRPSRAGGRAHLRAESALRGIYGQFPHTILRLAGIYGPGRVPRAADVIAGRPIASPEHGYLNLIHVDDAASVAINAMEGLQKSQSIDKLYVVSDDCPVIRADFYREIACRCRAPDPVFVDPDSGSGVKFRSETNKRVWNRRMKRDLLSQLQYPTYRDGLRTVLGR